MRKIVLLLIISLCSSFAFGQSIVVHDLQGNNITGSSQYQSDDACNTISMRCYILNVSSNSISIKATRNEISLTPGSQNAITFDQFMYAPTIDTSIMSSTIAPGDSVYFQGDYFANCIIGTSTIQYCFFNIQNTIDQSCFSVDFNGVIISVEESNFNSGYFSTYPNPCSGELMVLFPFLVGQSQQMNLFDALGNQIPLRINQFNENSVSIDVSEITNGFYFLSIIDDNGIMVSRKIQILHTR